MCTKEIMRLGPVLLLTTFFSYDLITFSDMTFPIGMNSEGTIVVGSNLSSQAVVWTEADGASIIGQGEFWGVSEDGKVAGSLINSNGKEEAAIWQDGTITFLGNIEGGNSCDAFLSTGLGISSDGSTVVGMGWEDCSVEAFYWNSLDGLIGLGQMNGNNTKAQAVNSDGSLIGGWAQNNSGTRQSCIWTAEGDAVLIGSLSPFSDAGEVMGFSSDGSKIIGFGASTGAVDTEAYIAYEDSTVLGGYNFIGLGLPPNAAGQSMAFDISDNNVVVGQYLNNWPNDWRASIWNEDLGTMQDFSLYLQSLGIEDLSGWTFLKAHCISDNGLVIAGTAQNSFGGWVTFIIDLEDELLSYMLGDLNEDEAIDILDIIVVVNNILLGDYSYLGDMNEDGNLDVTDVILILNIILE